jgi:hypothetical protein
MKNTNGWGGGIFRIPKAEPKKIVNKERKGGEEG